MRFWLGTHQPGWLARTDVPLFVSAVRLWDRSEFPKARGPWALDSGGFSEIAAHGRWTVSAQKFADHANKWAAEIGNLEWCAPQDWMCEPVMLARTRLTVRQHQIRTTDSYFALRRALPVIPVLQGWTLDDYLWHAEVYESAGIDLAGLPLVGVGSVCRRQGTAEAAEIVRTLHGRGYRLHGFGFKTLGLTGGERLAAYFGSSDSMAWSRRGRNAWKHEGRRLCGGDHTGGCVNCFRWATAWRDKLVSRIDRVTGFGAQLTLW